MKIQDILFLVVLLFLIFKKDSRWATFAGIGSIALSMPLFATWTFFTAERLVWYGASFLLLSILLAIWKR